jgi:putative DNA primase/helicase
MTDTISNAPPNPENSAPASPPEGSVSASEADIAVAIEAADQREPHEINPELASGKSLDLICASYLFNDMGNANRLRARFGRDLIFVKDAGWFAWTGSHWSLEEGFVRAERCAHAAVAAIFKEAAALEQLGPKLGETDAQFAARIKAHKAWAVRSGNSNKISAMLSVAAPYLTRQMEDFDANVYLFNCANGTIDLRVLPRTLQKHRREDLLTKCSPASYRPDADAPVFRAFLAKVQTHEDVRLYIQKYFGYSMTGLTSEQCLLLFYGGGSNGKSTLMESLKHVLGNYAATIPISSLLYDDRARGSEASPDIARLPGTRLVMASEPEVGARLSESRLKAMTGGEDMITRHLNKGFFEFKPQFKLTLSFNNKPTVRGQDDGIWRRLIMVPFDVKIPPGERDRNLPEKLHAEQDGILNWLLDGYDHWDEQGLVPPERVLKTTSEYRLENDPVGQFIESACRSAPGTRERAADMYAAYQKWCTDNAALPISQTAFSKRVSEKGYGKDKSSTILWIGLRIIDEYRPKEKVSEGVYE